MVAIRLHSGFDDIKRVPVVESARCELPLGMAPYMIKIYRCASDQQASDESTCGDTHFRHTSHGTCRRVSYRAGGLVWAIATHQRRIGRRTGEASVGPPLCCRRSQG